MVPNTVGAPFAIATHVYPPPLPVGPPPNLIRCLSGPEMSADEPRMGPHYNLDPQRLGWNQLQPSCMSVSRYSFSIEGPSFNSNMSHWAQ